MAPGGNHRFKLDNMQDKRGAAVVAPGSGHRVSIELPEAITLSDEDVKYALLMRHIA